MAIPLYIVDAFAERPFAGNPAAVCLLETWPNDAWLASVAAEMNLSETAFLVERGGLFDLRWLTPAVEVDLCGHATLASAAVLWHAGRVAPSATIRFATRSGILSAARRGELIELDFPLGLESANPPPAGLLEALGTQARYVGRDRTDWLIELGSEAEVRSLAPDFARLAAVECRGVIVTAAAAGSEFDFVSRFFAPAAGVDEDPVTGSAHCTLAGFWHKRLGKSAFRAYQASRRGGVVHVRIEGDRVRLGGPAVIVATGSLAKAVEPDLQTSLP